MPALRSQLGTWSGSDGQILWNGACLAGESAHSPGVLPQSDTEAFLWAKRAGDGGLAKAMYAVGYFYEVGIGTPPN
jgi:TPR repeat protein